MHEDLQDATRRPSWHLYAIGWASYAIAFALAVASEARTPWLGVSRWAAHVLVGAGVGVLLVHVLSRRASIGHWTHHLVGAAVTALVWAIGAALVMDVLLGSPRAFASLLEHPGRARWQLLAGALMYALTVAGVQWARAVRRAAAAQATAERESRLRTEAELEALRSRLDPHFLFNTLHSVLSLARTDQGLIEPALEKLGSLLRYTLRTHQRSRDLVVLAREWRFVEDYLELERIRLGERLRVESDVSDAASCVEIPPFTLQPLVENAIKHAVATRETPTTVRITAQVTDDALAIVVADDGPGCEGDPLAKGDGTEARGIGLRAIRERLRLRYRDAASMVWRTPAGGGFEVAVQVPLEASA